MQRSGANCLRKHAKRCLSFILCLIFRWFGNLPIGRHLGSESHYPFARFCPVLWPQPTVSPGSPGGLAQPLFDTQSLKKLVSVHGRPPGRSTSAVDQRPSSSVATRSERIRMV